MILRFQEIRARQKSEAGQVLIEFVFAMIIFLAFISGLLSVSWWGIGGEFVQQAAQEAASKYATDMDSAAAEQRARNILGKWAYLFIQPGSINVNVWRNGDTAHAEISAEPKFKKLYVYILPRIEKTSSCTLEYRFRNPKKFLH